jgi:hypothetical protein
MAKKTHNQTDLTLTGKQSNRNNVAPPQVTHSAELTKMDDAVLGNSIKESFNDLVLSYENFKRESMAQFRAKVLPLLNEATRRIKELKQPVDGCTKVDEYYLKLGLNPGTVRMWVSRANIKLTDGGKKGEDLPELVKVFESLQMSTMKSDIKRLMMNPKLSDKLRVKLSKSLIERGNKMVELAKELQTKTIDATVPTKPLVSRSAQAKQKIAEQDADRAAAEAAKVAATAKA